VRRRSDVHKAIFDAGNLVLAAGAAGVTFHALDGTSRLLAAALAGCVYAALNNGLVCLAMSLAEHRPWRTVWLERFHWARFYFLLFGPLALVAETAYNLKGVQSVAYRRAARIDDALGSHVFERPQRRWKTDSRRTSASPGRPLHVHALSRARRRRI
jgi:hypothetical protein